jgi:trehalose 6-phosphate synthase/phosphatase
MINIYNRLSELQSSYLKSSKRILFLDDVCTLEPDKIDPQNPSEEVKSMLKSLSSDPSNYVVIISGRDRLKLEKSFSNLPVTLVAEHGGFHKEGGDDWTTFFDESVKWKNIMYASLQALMLEFEGSTLEENYYSLVWNYSKIKDRISTENKNQIISAINLLPSRGDFFLYHEDGAFQLVTKAIRRGNFAKKYFSKNGPFEFILSIGGSNTHEDLFEAIGKRDFTIKVGIDSSSSAQYFLKDQNEVLPFLNHCCFLSQIYLKPTSSKH